MTGENNPDPKDTTDPKVTDPKVTDPKDTTDPKVTDPKVTTDDNNKSIHVELFGEQIELPYEQAKKMIGKRDERTAAMRDLAAKVEKYEQDMLSERRRAEAAEAAKKGDLAEAEIIFARKHQEQLDRYRNVTINAALSAALQSDERFVGGAEALSDSLALLSSRNEFEVGDDLTVKAGDKQVDVLVKEFLDGRPAFCRQTNKAPGFPTNTQKGNPAPVNKGDVLTGMAAALKGRFK